jgi:hypothetical protein
MPFLEVFGKGKAIGAFDGSAVFNGSGIHRGEGIVVICAKGICVSTNDGAGCFSQIDAVCHQFIVLILDEHSVKMGVRICVGCDLVSVINKKGTNLLGMNTLGFGIAEILGIEVKGTLHAVFIEKLHKSSILRTAVVIAERERIAFAVLESVK